MLLRRVAAGEAHEGVVSSAGGAEQLFGKKKSRGYEAVLSKITVVSAVLFIGISLTIVALFS